MGRTVTESYFILSADAKKIGRKLFQRGEDTLDIRLRLCFKS